MIRPIQQDEAFLTDLDRAGELAPESLHAWWLGQSGFLLQWHGHRLLLDPYLSDSLTRKYAGTDKPHVRMTERVIDPARLTGIQAVTASHAHTDHLDPETLRYTETLNEEYPTAILPTIGDRIRCAEPVEVVIGLVRSALDTQETP